MTREATAFSATLVFHCPDRLRACGGEVAESVTKTPVIERSDSEPGVPGSLARGVLRGLLRLERAHQRATHRAPHRVASMARLRRSDSSAAWRAASCWPSTWAEMRPRARPRRIEGGMASTSTLSPTKLFDLLSVRLVGLV